MVEKHAAVDPLSLAIEIVGHETLTYEDVNARANQLAHFLDAELTDDARVVALYLE